MDFQTFKRLTGAYRSSIGRGRAARNGGGQEVIRQSQSIWFSKKEIQELLDQTDDETGGIKFHFAVYETEDQPEKSNEDYSGKLTLVLSPSNNNEDPKEDTTILNGGMLCPPDCKGDI